MQLCSGIVLGVLLIPTSTIAASTNTVSTGTTTYNISHSDTSSGDFIKEKIQNLLNSLPSEPVSVSPFHLKIKKKLLLGFIMTHRDIDAWFGNGQVTGLNSIKVQKCRNTVVDGEHNVVSCSLNLDNVTETYEAAVTGFSIFGGMRNEIISISFRGTSYELKIRYDKSYTHGRVITFVLERFRTVVFAPDFGFNSERKFRFENRIALEAINSVVDMISNKIVFDLNRMLKDTAVKR
ncbi:hypothetical protein BIW11_07628 [Tropilaelaps mercedesae]|uniref:Secreted protein n=1 Tax=Tropilaelaps mercedesae TaxID=418985 RepID=A0A1V9XT40_9ACAR|nr:hypothetical protein BIW11_07628 [Tropilaelaps mercedesae]